MKMKMFCIALLASVVGYGGLAQAATYTIDFDSAEQKTSATRTFAIDAFTGIDSASMDFVIKGHTYSSNSRFSWSYDSSIDLSITGAQVLDDYNLGGDFTVLHFDLGADALSYMLANQSAGFSIDGQWGYWSRDDGVYGAFLSRFYLDSVSLNVTPSAVPLPGALWLFGSGLLGLVGVSKRRKAVAQ